MPIVHRKRSLFSLDFSLPPDEGFAYRSEFAVVKGQENIICRGKIEEHFDVTMITVLFVLYHDSGTHSHTKCFLG